MTLEEVGGYLLASLLGGVLLGLTISLILWKNEKKDLLNRALYGRDYLYYQNEQEAGRMVPGSNPDETRSAVEKRLKKMGLDADSNQMDAIMKQREAMRKAGRVDLL